jgi:hypothetical protein
MHCQACIEKIKSALSPYFKIIQITFDPPLLQIEAEQAPQLNELNNYLARVGKYTLQALSGNFSSSETTVSPESLASLPSLASSQSPTSPQSLTSPEKPSSPENPASPQNPTSSEQGLALYYPIFLIAAYITGVSFLNNFHEQPSGQMINWQGWMNQFMAGFFLVFSAFKFLNLSGFADGYASYDLLAKRWHAYGYIYPFIELSLGILYLTLWFPITTQIITIMVMGFSSLGVINSLRKKQQFQCACLGTILKVPLSSITLIEDLSMVILAILSLMMMIK